MKLERTFNEEVDPSTGTVMCAFAVGNVDSVKRSSPYVLVISMPRGLVPDQADRNFIWNAAEAILRQLAAGVT